MFDFTFDFKVIHQLLWVNRGMVMFIVPIIVAALVGYIYYATKISLYIDDIAEDNYSNFGLIKKASNIKYLLKNMSEILFIPLTIASAYLKYTYTFWIFSIISAALIVENIFTNRDVKIVHNTNSRLIFILSTLINSAFLGFVIYFYYEVSNTLSIEPTLSILILASTYNFIIFLVPALSNILIYPIKLVLTKMDKKSK